MKEVRFHYGKGKITHSFSEEELIAVLESSINSFIPEFSKRELIEKAKYA